jgi:hypothetical protein
MLPPCVREQSPCQAAPLSVPRALVPPSLLWYNGRVDESGRVSPDGDSHFERSRR